MFLVGLILHVTLLLTISFFVLFAAQRATGLVKLLGNIVGIWLLVLAVLIVVGCVTAPLFGGRVFGMTPMDRHVEVRITSENRTEAPSQAAPSTAPSTAPAPASGAHP